MRTLRNNFTALVAILALASVTTVAAIAQGDEQSAPGDGVTQVTAIEAEAQAAMEVLDESRTSTDAMPADVAEPLDNQADFGMNPELSRLAIGNISGSVYVVPADEHVCATLTVGDHGANVSCPETDDVAAGQSGPATVTLEGGPIAIYGIVPDGVESVTVATGEADSDSVAVTDNAYYTVVPQGTPLRTVSYTGPSGAVEFPIYDPSLVFEDE